ncbi:hypothetical protein DFH28DRAFT_1104047 [Melampsora americana]|nr:hypothetical protein DFH28DRAFT_1104047 [Melampsora americana]
MNQDQESDIENLRLLSNHQEEETESESGQISRLFQREINPFESNLIILSLICLCLSSIGFGLFAGEVSKLNEFQKNQQGGETNRTHTVVVTKTEICYSDSCIDAAGELRKIIDWDAKPCEDFNKFAMSKTGNTALEDIKTNVNYTIHHLLKSQDSFDPILQTLNTFHTTCIEAKNEYEQILPFLKQISDLWNQSELKQSRTLRLTSLLSYLHAHSIPVFFINSIRNQKIYSNAEERNNRVNGVKRLHKDLMSIKSNPSSKPESISINYLQWLVCNDKPAPCLIRWKEYYSSLNSQKPISKILVDGLDYFQHLSSVIASYSDQTIESYFHWIAISTLVEHRASCDSLLQSFFGSILSKRYLSIASNGQHDLMKKIETAHFVLSVMLNSTTEKPIEIVFPSIEDEQLEELKAVQEINHVGNLIKLHSIQTKKMFERNQKVWNMLEPEIEFDERQVFCPVSIIQTPIVYSSPEVPIGLTFGSLGVLMAQKMLMEKEDLVFHDRSVEFNRLVKTNFAFCFLCWSDKMQAVSLSYQKWKAISKQHQKDKSLIGLKDLDINQLFFISFSKLGYKFDNDEIEKLEELNEAFGCKKRN